MTDETSRKTKELEFSIGELVQNSYKMDDLKDRVAEIHQNVQNKYMTTTHAMTKMNNDLESFRSDFRKEEEYMRVARKVTDNLQEEYCRIVHSVASEKQRNLMYIEHAKREFIDELISVNERIGEFSDVAKRVKAIEDRLEVNAATLA